VWQFFRATGPSDNLYRSIGIPSQIPTKQFREPPEARRAHEPCRVAQAALAWTNAMIETIRLG